MAEQRREQVIDPDTLVELTRRSDRHGLWRLVQHVAALGACLAVVASVEGPVAVLAWLLYSVILTFSFCPLHESIHGSAFRSTWLNRVTGVAFGWVLVLPPRYFEAFHMAHHRHTQIPGRDPELASPKPASRLRWIWHVSGLPYWIAQWLALLRNATGTTESFVPERREAGIIREARLYLCSYLIALLVSIWLGSALLWWWWLLPMLIGQPFLRLYLLAEHTGCPEVRDMFENTRTTLTNRLMGWLCWNMNYHTAHHAYAGIPFWRLAEANQLIATHTRVVSSGYRAVNREIFTALD